VSRFYLLIFSYLKNDFAKALKMLTSRLKFSMQYFTFKKEIENDVTTEVAM